MSTQIQQPSSQLKTFQQTLKQRLAQVRYSLRKHILFDAITRLLLILLGLALFSLGADWSFELALTTRFILLFVGGVGVSYFLFRHLILPMRWSLPPIEVATLIDKSHHLNHVASEVAPRVASVLQLPEQMAIAGQSSAMIEQAVTKNFHDLEKIDFQNCINPRHLKSCVAILFSLLLFSVAFAYFLPTTTELWAKRWFGASNEAWPRNTYLTVEGLENGKLFVPRGEAVSLQISVTDKAKPSETVWLKLVSEAGIEERLTMTRFRPGDFRHDLPPVQQSIVAHVWGGDSQTISFEIIPIDRPRISTLKLTATHPYYQEPKVFHFTADEGNIRLLPESSTHLELTTNIPVSELIVETEEGKAIQWKQINDHTFSTEWKHQIPVRFQLALKSSDHGLVSHPRSLSIGIQPDRPPHVTFRYTGTRQRVTPQATIPLALTARDDFGIHKINFSQRISAIEDSSFDLPEDKKKPKKEIIKTIPWYGPQKPTEETIVDLSRHVALAKLNVLPGQTVVFQSTVFDDCFTGQQKTDSRQLLFRVVKSEELFREILLRQQQLQARLRKSATRAEQLQAKIPKATLPNDISGMLRSHQQTKREIAQISRELKASVLEMKLNKIGGEETHQLITQTVINPLNQIHQRLMEQQKQSLDSLRSKNPESLVKIKKQQKEIVDKLKKTLNNMAQWDSFIDVVNQLNSIIKLEHRIREKTEELLKKQTDSLFEK